MNTDTTAMQDLVSYFNKNKLWPKNELWQIEIDKMIGVWKQKEKEQICKAWEDGYYSNGENLQNENERYYNETYQQKINL